MLERRFWQRLHWQSFCRKNAKMQKRKNAKMQKCKNARENASSGERKS
jgi:hypothetical protein